MLFQHQSNVNLLRQTVIQPRFLDCFAVVPSTDLLSTSAYMASYDPSACASTCDANSRCAFFNIYVTNSPDVGVYCAYYARAHIATDANNSTTPSGQLVHQSAGYTKKVQILYSSSSSIMYSSMTTKPLTAATVPTNNTNYTSKRLLRKHNLTNDPKRTHTHYYILHLPKLIVPRVVW